MCKSFVQKAKTSSLSHETLKTKRIVFQFFVILKRQKPNSIQGRKKNGICWGGEKKFNFILGSKKVADKTKRGWTDVWTKWDRFMSGFVKTKTLRRISIPKRGKTRKIKRKRKKPPVLYSRSLIYFLSLIFLLQKFPSSLFCLFLWWKVSSLSVFFSFSYKDEFIVFFIAARWES